MGYEIERFESDVNDGLLCCICRDVLEDPLQASACEHAYCRSCIHGWLVHQHICPEDRQPLHISELRPLFRYMKNDLERLEIRCRNRSAGCTVVCSLDRVRMHENECEFHSQECPSVGCTVWLSRSELDEHLTVCEFRTKECANGCGLPILSRDDESHNCIMELRTSLELLHSEMICKLQEQRQELDLRLDAQRRHMIQKEATVRAQTDDFKAQIQKLTQDVVALKASEARRTQELEQANLEKKELLEIVRTMQREIIAHVGLKRQLSTTT